MFDVACVRRVSGDSVVWVDWLDALASNGWHQLFLINVPRNLSSGDIQLVLVLVPHTMEVLRLVSPFLSAPLVGCTTNLEAHVAFHFVLSIARLVVARIVVLAL